MRYLIFLLLVLIASSALSFPASAGDVYVNGYTRKDGTYVRPHVRSSPDSTRSNNYGPSQNSYELMQPRSRDYDRDGTPNYLDRDDDNDRASDDSDSSQFGNGW